MNFSDNALRSQNNCDIYWNDNDVFCTRLHFDNNIFCIKLHFDNDIFCTKLNFKHNWKWCWIAKILTSTSCHMCYHVNATNHDLLHIITNNFIIEIFAQKHETHCNMFQHKKIWLSKLYAFHMQCCNCHWIVIINIMLC